MNDRVQELIDLGVITDGGLPLIVVSQEIADSIDKWAKDKKITSPTKDMEKIFGKIT